MEPGRGSLRLWCDCQLDSSQGAEIRDHLVTRLDRDLNDRTHDHAVAVSQPLSHGSEQRGHRAHHFSQVLSRGSMRPDLPVDDEPSFDAVFRPTAVQRTKRERAVKDIRGDDAVWILGRRAAKVYELERGPVSSDRLPGAAAIDVGIDIVPKLEPDLCVGAESCDASAAIGSSRLKLRR
jgi:hypothetical protein